ncbi:hypothetical protein NG798_26010 [Ancylothrix sp. C2]|uniref:hypothetical protein n=1 Tax=Ancylothrix sp. D3o TaxID=2953691 RepID=UPI0021BB2A1E|nr:hypothetical protein [Ancylothrix sp. D3o]MCT7953258.1 hypothetical protein [Ancylothrix sp. D3o]
MLKLMAVSGRHRENVHHRHPRHHRHPETLGTLAILLSAPASRTLATFLASPANKYRMNCSILQPEARKF